MKTALITGATSGIGMEFARAYAAKGYRLLVTGRREDRLKQLQEELDVPVEYYIFDLGKKKECFALLDALKDETIDVFINNAGFGLAGSFVETDLEREISMVKLNDIAMHILFKGILQRMVAVDSGSILNVASSAGFLSGPLMATYYATKGYVLKLTEAIYEELRRDKSNVYIGALCPGPVDTEFNKVAKVKFSIKPLSAQKVAEYAVDQMFKRKLIIVPGFKTKFVKLSGLLPRKLLLRLNYNIQKKKDD